LAVRARPGTCIGRIELGDRDNDLLYGTVCEPLDEKNVRDDTVATPAISKNQIN